MLAATLGRCEVPGCMKWAVCKHHIYTIGAHKNRARVEINEFDCYGDHHTLSGDSWHQLGRDSFAEKHGLEGRVRDAEIAVKGVRT